MVLVRVLRGRIYPDLDKEKVIGVTVTKLSLNVMKSEPNNVEKVDRGWIEGDSRRMRGKR